MPQIESKWVRVTADHPCPACEKPDWCTMSADGAVACCMRVESDKQAKNGGWIHRLSEPLPHPPPRRPTKKLSHEEWGPIIRRLCKCPRERIEKLAAMLGVSRWSLDALHVGYGELAGTWCWTFPERGRLGQWTGIARRLAENQNGTNKKAAPGSRRGLTYAANWKSYTGPVFIVEGGSDVAAGLTLGLCVVGRPSNVGGIEQLAPLLSGVDKLIYVIGERDRKRHEDLPPVIQKEHKPKCTGCAKCWPGWHGARTTAHRLAKLLGRTVRPRLMTKAKDLREWLNGQGVDVEDRKACFEQGRWLIEEMLSER